MNGASQIFWYPLAVWEALRARWQRVGDYRAVQMARLAPPATAFVSQPEPRSYGLSARGVQILAGNHLFNGEVVEIPGQSLWSLPTGDPQTIQQLHGFAWLDDVAAVDTAEARDRAQAWVFEWLDTYGTGRGPGWAPDVTGRRVVRWINHAILILHQADRERSRAYFQSLGHQCRFLLKRWRSMRPGLARFEALTGLVYCGLALEGQGSVLRPALRALGQECAREIRADGGIESRNPEELMEIFTLLSWVNQAVSVTRPAGPEAGNVSVGPDILRALERMAPAIRSLRLGDGAMVRFHGGAAGQPERVDQALADAGIRSPARPEGSMGYSRLAAARTLIVMDTGLMPGTGSRSGNGERAHACTLSFELSSGRIPVLVNMGPANGFEAKMRSASRATGAHNGVDVAGTSLARFAGSGFVRRTFGLRLTDAPRRVTLERDSNEHGQAILASHDGYSQTHGLVHRRQIAVVHSGAEVQGIDRMTADTTSQKVRFSRAAGRATPKGSLPFSVHFHLHPDVAVDLDMGGAVASLTLPNGETWLLRAMECDLELRDSIYFEQGRLKPRATKQIVATGAVVDYEGAINWTLSRPA